MDLLELGIFCKAELPPTTRGKSNFVLAQFVISKSSCLLACTPQDQLPHTCVYVCMVITYSKNIDQPGKVTNPARGQLNRGNEYFPVPVLAREFGLARRVRQSRPASAC